MKPFIHALIFMLLSSAGFSQTREQLVDVIKNTDVETLQSLKVQFQKEYLERESRITDYLSRNPHVSKKEINGFAVKEIYDVLPTGEILYYQTSNFNSSRTSRTDRLYNGGSLGLNIQGQGMKAYVWDGGGARTTHFEFPGSKVSIKDGATLNDHATHVMGTIVAQGVTANLRGIAFDASGDSFDWTNDYTEMSSEVLVGMLVSNHSYWSGSTLATWTFGAYDNRARQFDQIAFAAPYYLAVTAAGNDRNDFTDPVIGPYLNQKFGYNLLRGMQNAKNFLTVGAVSQVLNYTSPSSVQMSDFSSWGPTDDGRIKPDVVTKGVSVRSTLSTNNSANGILQGTSMASPNVAGTALLLQQYYQSLNVAFLRAASLKGLILHTADEAGLADGPDYEYGWGLVNAEKAAIAIAGKQQNTAIIDELVLLNGQTYTRTFSAGGTEPLMASISWTDAAGTANNGNVDPVNSNLINDLDIRITKATDVFFPWTVNPADPFAAAVRTTDNFRDNFEKIQIDNPTGEYTLTVSHKGTLAGALQNFSLIVTGPNVNLSTSDLKTSSFNVYPNPTKGLVNINYESTSDNYQIEVYDLQGRLIQQLTSNTIQTSFDVSGYTDGVYLVNCTDGDKSITKKIVLSR